MNPASIFERNYELHQLPATLRLRNLDWSAYFTIDGMKTAGEIQAHFRLDGAQRDEVFTRLLQMELIREKKVNLQEHIQAIALNADPSDSRVKNLDEFIGTGSAGRTAPLLAPPESHSPARTEYPSPVFTPLPSPHSVKTMSLLSVIRFILEQNRDKTAGQLAIYRVFMGVDTKLLKKNGIHSLRFQEDRLITDPELQKAIEDNVSKALRKNLPREVFLVS